MTEQEAAKQSAELLRRIIRSIDKNLTYSLAESSQQGQVSLRLSARGKTGLVSLQSEAIRAALGDDVRRNAIRQKIKATRDHMLSVYAPDVLGLKMARLLKQSKSTDDTRTYSYFTPRGGQRRR